MVAIEIVESGDYWLVEANSKEWNQWWISIAAGCFPVS